MGNWNELSLAVSELRECGELLISISDSLKEALGSREPASLSVPAEENKTQKTVPEEKPVTKEDIRKVLGIKVKEGHRSEVQALIRKYGGEKLGDIEPARYAEMIREAEVIGNA
jgi:hypothetical protein